LLNFDAARKKQHPLLLEQALDHSIILLAVSLDCSRARRRHPYGVGELGKRLVPCQVSQIDGVQMACLLQPHFLHGKWYFESSFNHTYWTTGSSLEDL